eukprot:TRINITY_DN1089_c0_g2_i1.p1 TRINITY_DN1089_c0_g2~~TRINITY_DN1089_c0_g2_i1.p1  ORF type:complete len:316 (-),score=81.46 TRINITY_DN1089_c0_g2_i1:69-974(-)
MTTRYLLTDGPQDVPSAITQEHTDKISAFSKNGSRANHKYNEDSYFLISDLASTTGVTTVPNGVVMVGVCDGHGGVASSRFACQHMPKLLASAEHFPSDVKQAFVDGFLATDHELNQLVSDGTVEAGSGSCAVCVLVMDNTLYVANLGDSRAVLGTTEGIAIALTKDHKAVEPSEMARLQECGGFVSDQRLFGALAISRSLGDFEFKKVFVSSDDSKDKGPALIAVPEMTVQPIESNHHFVMLASDGVWDVFNNEQAVTIVSEALTKSPRNNPQNAARALAEAASEKGSDDDITVIVYLLH